MADDLELNVGSGGATLAADEIASVHHQRVKVQHGADGSATDVSTASPMPVDIRSDNVGGIEVVQDRAADLNCTEASAADIKTAVELLDNAVDGNYLNTNLNLAGTDVTANAGAVAAGTPRVTLASDDPAVALLGTMDADTGAIKTAVEIIDNAISGSEMQVDVVAPLPAGTNNIGDVDVLTLPGSIQGPASPTVDSYTNVAINITTGVNIELVAIPGASKQIWVYGYALTCGDANGQTVELMDEDDTKATGIMEFAQYGGISVPPSGNFSMPVFKLASNKALDADVTGGDVDGWLAYAIVSV